MLLFSSLRISKIALKRKTAFVKTLNRSNHHGCRKETTQLHHLSINPVIQATQNKHISSLTTTRWLSTPFLGLSLLQLNHKADAAAGSLISATWMQGAKSMKRHTHAHTTSNGIDDDQRCSAIWIFGKWEEGERWRLLLGSESRWSDARQCK